MKASDTVIEPEDMDKNTHQYVIIKTLLEAQAEISFKAGKQEVIAEIKGIYFNANDLKELETLIKEYLNSTAHILK